MYRFLLEDKEIDPMELIVLQRIGKEQGISQEQMDQIFLQPVENKIPENFDDKIDNLYDYTSIIWADGVVTEDEKKLLNRYIIDYGFLPENADKLAEFLIEEVKNGVSKDDVLAIIKSL